jgi:hypothetical protein
MTTKKRPGLWANINRRKKLGISRPKSKSTIANMKKEQEEWVCKSICKYT